MGWVRLLEEATLTIFTVDNLPAPSDFELKALDRQNARTRCHLEYFMRVRNVDASRPYFRQFVADQGRAETVLSLWQWESLLAVYDSIGEGGAQPKEEGGRYGHSDGIGAVG